MSSYDHDFPSVSVENTAGVRVVALRGEHDVSIAAACAGPPVPIVVDLSAATFIDSAVISTLIPAHTANEGSGFAVAVDPDSHPARILSLVLADTVLPTPNDADKALDLVTARAEKHNVLPLLAGFSAFFGMLPPMPTVTTHTFCGDVQNVASGMIPRIYGRSYAIEAELKVPQGGAEGVIVAEADEMGGFSLWVDENGLLHHSYSMIGVEQYKQVSTQPIPTGHVTVRMQFDADRQERSAGGTVSLYATPRIGEGRLEKTVFFRFSAYAGMDIGRDNGLVVGRAYVAKAPYPFSGTVKKVVFDLKPGTHEAETALHEATAHVATAHGISA